MPTLGLSQSATDFVTDAMKDLGVLAAGLTATGGELLDGAARLNQLWDTWRVRRLLIPSAARTVFPLAASTAAYTIGPGGTFDVPRPTWLDALSVVPDRSVANVNEIPIGPALTLEEYQRIPIKTTTSTYPLQAYYDHGFSSTGRGTIYVYPVPTSSACDLVLYLPVAIDAFADLSTKSIFPPAYAMAIRTNLALVIAPMFGSAANPSDDLRRMAREGLDLIETSNVRPAKLGFDPRLVGARGRANLRSGVV